MEVGGEVMNRLWTGSAVDRTLNTVNRFSVSRMELTHHCSWKTTSIKATLRFQMSLSMAFLGA